MPGTRGLTGPDKRMLSVLLTGDERLTMDRLAWFAGAKNTQAVFFTDYLEKHGYATEVRHGLVRVWRLTGAGVRWGREQLGRDPLPEHAPEADQPVSEAAS